MSAVDVPDDSDTIIPRARGYHTAACGRATTPRCRCACGGARHGELLKKSDIKVKKISKKEEEEWDRIESIRVQAYEKEMSDRLDYQRLHPERTEKIPVDPEEEKEHG